MGVKSNQCQQVSMLKFGEEDARHDITAAALWEAILALFKEDCYSEEATPLNVFRAVLFLLQCLVWMVAVLYGVLRARYFIQFALVITKYDLTKDPDDLL